MFYSVASNEQHIRYHRRRPRLEFIFSSTNLMSHPYSIVRPHVPSDESWDKVMTRQVNRSHCQASARRRSRRRRSAVPAPRAAMRPAAAAGLGESGGTYFAPLPVRRRVAPGRGTTEATWHDGECGAAEAPARLTHS